MQGFHRIHRDDLERQVELIKSYAREKGWFWVQSSTPREELVEDLVTIISHFAGKLYGMRSHKYKEVVEGAKKLIRDP